MWHTVPITTQLGLIQPIINLMDLKENVAWLRKNTENRVRFMPGRLVLEIYQSDLVHLV